MKYLILGASGWIGHHLCLAARKLDPGASVIGTRCKNPLYAPVRAASVDYRSPGGISTLIRRERPDLMLNAIAGTDESLYHFHVAAVAAASSINTHYGFISSSMVFDHDLSHPHRETDAIGARSDYGKFKERCERTLATGNHSSAIFRFSATHGYAPNRISRTEKFLQQLGLNKAIPVDTGVFQNRLGVGHVAEAMVAIMQKRGAGVFHLGSTDQSEEVSFLRRVAAVFGYSPEKIIEKLSEPKYFTTVPEAIVSLLGPTYQYREAQTIAYIANLPQFRKYQRKK